MPPPNTFQRIHPIVDIMIDLSKGDISNVPAEILALYSLQRAGTPVNISTLTQLMGKYPEYFPEEIAHINKWNNIPDEVKQSYYNRLEELRKEIYKNVEGSSLYAFVNNTEDLSEWFELTRKMNEVEQLLYDEIIAPYMV
jgi:hypothetical protein